MTGQMHNPIEGSGARERSERKRGSTAEPMRQRRSRRVFRKVLLTRFFFFRGTFLSRFPLSISILAARLPSSVSPIFGAAGRPASRPRASVPWGLPLASFGLRFPPEYPSFFRVKKVQFFAYFLPIPH